MSKLERKTSKTWINLPDVPPELLRPAREDDGDDIELARWRALTSYCSWASVETLEEAKKLILNLAALLFPAFREPTRRKRPGRPLAPGPKYEVEFLKEAADAFDEMKSRNKTAISDERFFDKFLAENTKFAEKLRYITWGTFEKLLSVGRAARDKKVIWRVNKKPLPWLRRLPGPYVEVDPVLGELDEALRFIGPSAVSALPDIITALDPTDEVDRRTIKAFYNFAMQGLHHRAKSHEDTPEKSAAVEMLARMENARKFNS